MSYDLPDDYGLAAAEAAHPNAPFPNPYVRNSTAWHTFERHWAREARETAEAQRDAVAVCAHPDDCDEIGNECSRDDCPFRRTSSAVCRCYETPGALHSNPSCPRLTGAVPYPDLRQYENLLRDAIPYMEKANTNAGPINDWLAATRALLDVASRARA